MTGAQLQAIRRSMGTETEMPKILIKHRDHVFQTREGWFCIVANKVYGTWACREYAQAGMQTEQNRWARKLTKNEEQCE
jgi:hypothetical protein